MAIGRGGGVSTRRVDQLVESLGLRISKSEVSRTTKLLNEQVQAFRERALEGRYPYLFVDAKVEKVRAGGRVVRDAVVSHARDHEGMFAFGELMLDPLTHARHACGNLLRRRPLMHHLPRQMIEDDRMAVTPLSLIVRLEMRVVWPAETASQRSMELFQQRGCQFEIPGSSLPSIRFE